MACACKVTKQIDYLHKKYGDDIPQSKKTNIRGMIAAKAKIFFIYILAIPLIPIFAVYAIYKLIAGETINIDKFVKKNVREQQII